MRGEPALFVLVTGLALVPLFGAQAAEGIAVHGLCTNRETTYLACQTSKSRWVSLCGSPDKLQYRYGRKNRIDLQYPENAREGPQKLLFAQYFRAQTYRTEVRFELEGSDYVLFDYQDGLDHSAGVRVVTPDQKEHELVCRGPVASRLGELKSVLRCDADSALNGGQCQ